MTESTQQSGNKFTPSEALQLVSGFFEKEWLSTSETDVQLRRITGGFCHCLHLLTRSNTAIREPVCVLIRHFGPSGNGVEPIGTSTTLSAAEQSVIYHEMGRRGWGPRIYGMFRGGRLEEYIDAHTLTCLDFRRLDVRRDVARSYARLHSLELPFRKNAFVQTIYEFKKFAEKKDEIVQRLSKTKFGEMRDLAEIIRDTAWCEELDWLADLFERYRCKKTLAIGDTNFLNVLVKDHWNDTSVVLIDYETVTYSYRGIDIGGHFNEHMYRWSHPVSVLTGHSPPDIVSRASFCQFYLDEIQALGQELTENDTVDHLLVESSIGQMYQILFSFLMGGSMEGIEDVTSFPLVQGLVHMLKTYTKLKREFMSLISPS